MKCISPIQISRPEGLKQLVPCGHCLNCGIKRQQAWSLRMMLEASEHASNSFVTLTYEEHTRPGKLEYEHISRFLKRWRRNIGPVRFFCVGEYGKQTKREHWHLMMFGVHPWQQGQSLIELWPHGFVHAGHITRQSANYVGRYSLKSGVHGDKYLVQASRRPGIGLDALKQIGTWLAGAHPQLPSLPSYWRLGSSTVSLDRTSREALSTSYKGAGGVVEREDYSPLRLDLDARLYAIAGDPLRSAKMRKLIQIERSDISHGSI